MNTSEKEKYEQLIRSIKNLDLPKPKIIKPTEKELKQKSENSFYHNNGHICFICGCKFDFGKFKKDQEIFVCGECKIEFTCPECKKINIIKIKDLNKNSYNFLLECIKDNKLEEFWHFCSHEEDKPRCSTIFRNKLQYMRNISGETIKNWGIAHKEEQIELGRKYGTKNIITWSQSEKGRKSSSELGKIWGPINGKDSFKNFQSTEEGKKHIHKIALKNLETINNSKYQFCDNCNNVTPHTLDEKCRVCETNEYVWCDVCKKYETIEINSNPNHRMFYKSRTRKWIEEILTSKNNIFDAISDTNIADKEIAEVKLCVN